MLLLLIKIKEIKMALGTNYAKNANVLQTATVMYKMAVLDKDTEKQERFLNAIKNNTEFTEATKKKYLKSCKDYLERSNA
jgi:hypothetical protein